MSGLSFQFTQEQENFREKCRNLARNVILPVRDLYDKREEFPWETVKEMGEAGLFGIPIPEELGGLGLGEVEYGIALEELSYVCSAHATIIAAHTAICCMPILLFGTLDQKKRYLPSLAKGGKIGAFGLTEPTAGSDAGNIKLSAVKDGANYLLTGSKLFITNGNVADVILVIATVDPSLGHRGITAFIVEKNFPGFKVGKVERKMGIRASTTAELLFNQCVVPNENILGEVGRGFPIALTGIDGARAGLAAGTLGTSEYAWQLAVDYVKEQERVGALTSEHQRVRMALADMAMNLRAMRFLVYHTLREADDYFKRFMRGEKIPLDVRRRVTLNASIAKAYASEASSMIIEKCLEIHGVAGCVEGKGVEKLYRDSPVFEIFEGANEIQRLIIAQEALH